MRKVIIIPICFSIMMLLCLPVNADDLGMLTKQIMPTKPTLTVPTLTKPTQMAPTLPGKTTTDTALPNPDSLPILLDPRLQLMTFSAPENLELVKAEKNLVSIKWKDTAVIETLYVVERKIENKSYVEIKVLPKDSVSFEDRTVEPGITYYYRVKAGKEELNSATGKMEIKYSAYSNELKATTPTSDGTTTGGPIKDI